MSYLDKILCFFNKKPSLGESTVLPHSRLLARTLQALSDPYYQSMCLCRKNLMPNISEGFVSGKCPWCVNWWHHRWRHESMHER